MNKLYISNLTIEVTRRCNMTCAHCNRGDSQNKNIPNEKIEQLLSQTSLIGNILFTGGEPTLNVEAIRHTLDCCKKFKIPVFSVKIATNGKLMSDDFLHCMLDWYLYCVNFIPSECFDGVTISYDKYHDKINPINFQKLSAFSFAWQRFDSYEKKDIIKSGRAKSMPSAKEIYKNNSLDVLRYNNNYYILSLEFILTSTGNIVLNCDYAYEDEEKYKICTLDDLFNTVKQVSWEDDSVNFLRFFSYRHNQRNKNKFIEKD